ncbi:PAS domain-containing sensor histidine kinase [Pedobacter sp. MC2016-15]|uniref:sensor histidine kinase n=1 Tax=Pedobacter sp. MC2016-15 TaxID=2994473 RepID=UPI00224842F3|nr:PAS domain-containing sensor histidine kinase [Pedobacter sp. MC2016-15]MCX2478241.1 PAS domain-containing sensor histidine kinase [Pedobacter sp. MC2016-15]
MDLNKLLKLSGDLICTVDAHDRYVEVSDASYAILGYLPAEMCGKSYKEFLSPSDFEVAEEVVELLMSSQPNTQIQLRHLHKNGTIVPLFWSVHWDDEDQLMYCIARNGNITAQTEAMRSSLEESNKRYQYVTKATSDAIWDWNLVDRTIYWGEGLETIFGHKISDLPQGADSWTRFIHPEDAKYVLQSIKTACGGKETNWKEEYRYRKADGNYADVVDRGFVIRDEKGKAIRMVGAMHDISERKKGLNEMKQITEDLFKRNRELHEFGYIISHNLRSPVANIKGIASLMQIEPDTPEHLQQYLTNLNSSIANLDDVIIDLSKILSAKNRSVDLQMEKFDIRDVIDLICKEFSEKILQCDAHLTISGGPFTLRSNKAYIHSILHNLISNSITFLLDRPPVISIHLLQTDNSVYITYNDNGCGIDMVRYRSDVFKPYQRFHPGSKGKGLGLFLVKGYIEALNGSVNIDSEPGQGVTYMISIPKAE